MTSKSQPSYGQDAAPAPAEALSDYAPPRRERRRSAPAANRAPADALKELQRSSTAPAHVEPYSPREALIATAAYYRAARRGFLPGHELEDWLAAEQEIDLIGSDPI
jgi:hypothetical protein